MRLTWCEISVLAFLGSVALLIGEPFFTLAYLKPHWLILLRDAAVMWLFLRCIDLAYGFPERRAFKRHLDSLERKKIDQR